jgi:pimeloyl-ACP methyl ester carboxylesterase
MSKLLFPCILTLVSFFSFGQDSKGNFITDNKNGCTVWYKIGFPEDSVTWSGGCKNNLADGYGTLVGFTKGKPTSRYIGYMRGGKENGKGIFTFAGNRLKLGGNFSNGEILNLREDCMKHLHKQIVFSADSGDYYVNDNNEKLLYYHAIVPDGQIKGAVVLLPGTFETTEHLISSMQAFCELAYDNHLAVIVPSINQRITMTDRAIDILNTIFTSAIRQYNIPKDKFVLGGWSMGGLFSLRYTELANDDPTKTAIRPIAVFSCDGPCDLENIYFNAAKKVAKNPGPGEPAYTIAELTKYCGGTPSAVQGKYIYYSCYSHSQGDGGNAKFLKNTPVRIYDDVDPNWWMANRGVDMYDMNALDQSAMILLLNQLGNKQAAFIKPFGKGYRIEGNRHPHSWSIVDPRNTINWILTYVDQ